MDTSDKGLQMRLLRMLGAAAIAVLMVALLAGSASAKGKDGNRDRIPDRWERAHHLSLKVKQTKKDQDRDGLNNLNEYRSHTDPRDVDSDNDGLDDVDEDRDRDGVDNGNEQRERTNPGIKDTNHNGVRDGREDADRDALNNRGEDRTANDPVDSDTDDDGIKDGDEKVGTIDSFDATTGILVITGLDGTKVSGKVDGSTKIKCETEDENESEHNGGGPVNPAPTSEDDSGDDSGHHGDSSGPGDDDHGHDHGDDDSDGVRNDDEGDDDNVCTVADLLPGTVVHEAELKLTSAGAVWHEVELVK